VCVLSMSNFNLDVGHRPSLINRIKNTLATTALVSALAFSMWTGFTSPIEAGGETRTLSLYHIHTKESLTVTYMQNGRYIPSAMKKINYLMRDWRRNETVKMDPATVDLMWELHADLGSNRPIHIVCGFRSAKTNSFLKKIGRNVAKKSQHTKGKAIDLYFPDVPSVKIRSSALVRKVGGVGYYRSSGGPTGFVHIDSGNVRYWGPAISKSQWAQIFKEGKKTVGKRRSKQDQTLIATAEESAPPPSIESAYEGADDEMAALSASASKSPKKPKAEPVADQPSAIELMSANIVPVPKVEVEPAAEANAPFEFAKGYPMPKPRSKPLEILMMAAANMKIEPANAPPPTLVIREKPSQVADSAADVSVDANFTEEPVIEQASAAPIKGSFAQSLADGSAKDAPLIKPVMASAAESDINWWPQLLFNPDKAIRRDGRPSLFEGDVIPMEATLSGSGATQSSAEGKGDLELEVVREGKGNLEPLFLKSASN
jgi:uncharacterized protein YcbK (DUF882 family)